MWSVAAFTDEGWRGPAPKPGPALVLNVNDESVPQRVEVAYRTNQRTRSNPAIRSRGIAQFKHAADS